MARSAYVALYKAVMNINEDGHQPHGWHSLEGNRWIKCDTPTVTGITTSLTDDIKYPHWHPQPHRKTPGLDVPQPYATPKETGTAGHDARLNKELG